MTAIRLTDFVAIDLETTGLDFRTEEILEFGAVRFRGGIEVERFSRVVRVGRPLSAFIETLTGISAAEAAAGEDPQEALRAFLAFCGEDPLVAHNAGFDRRFIAKACESGWALAPAQPCFDTLLLARSLWPTLPAHRLESLVERFALVPEGGAAHRAEDDARAAGRLFLRGQEELTRLEASDPDLVRALAWTLHGSGSPLESLLPWEGGNRPEPPWPDQPEETSGRSGPPRPATLDPDRVKAAFAPGGALAVEGWEARPAQLDLALAVASTLNEGRFLSAEAGTGTGKSLAYLLPAALWALEARDRVVVSTATRQLQDQLVEKELPRVAEAAGEGFRWAVLKGRSNYLCVRRLSEHLADPSRLDVPERESLLPLLVWLRSTRTGDIEECHGFGRDRNGGLWAKLQSDGRAAIPPRHPLFRRCFHHRARRRAESAHVLVVNHALLLSDLALDFALLPAYEHLVLDEAHHLADAAHSHLGRSVSLPRLRRVLHPLAEGSDRAAGLLGTLAKVQGLPEAASARLAGLREEIQTCDRRLHRFFQKLGEKVGRRGEEQKLRLREGLVAETGADPTPALGALEAAVASLSALRQDLSEHGEAEERGWLSDLASAEGAISELRRDLQSLVDPPAEGIVHWIEEWSNPIRLQLRSSPLDPGSTLAGKLYPALRSCIFSSATLAVRGRPEPFERRCGLDRLDRGRLARVRHPSPFRLRDQARVVAAGWLPKPNEKGYAEALAKALREVVLPLRRRALVLFTSERSLRDQRDRLAADWKSAGRLLLAQGVDGNRDALLQMFRRHEGAMLLGADSFWEGVDLPGRELELVVVARLPFPVPGDPLVSARSEAVESEGGSSFSECFLPETWMKLRQGVGRLLRRADDRGAILVLDSRAVKERYGSYLADAWEGGHRQAKDPAQALELLGEWFDDAP